MTRTAICEYCKKEVETLSKKKRFKFCSIECFRASRIESLVTLICEYCKQEFQVEYGRRIGRKYCNLSCSASARNIERKYLPETRSCRWCGDDFKPKRISSEFCGYSCSSLFYHLENTKNLELRGFHALVTGSHEYNRVHAKVNKLRNKTFYCRVCNKHRYTYWANLGSRNPDNVYENFVEMCAPCHTRFDRRRVAVIGLCCK